MVLYAPFVLINIVCIFIAQQRFFHKLSLPAIIMRHLYVFIFILTIACSNRSRVKKSDPTIFDNIAVINYDSCQKWNLPLTSFQIRRAAHETFPNRH